MNQTRILAAAMTGVLVLGGCTDFKAHTYQGSQTMQPMHVKYGVVLEIRDVDIQGQQTGTGAATGAAIGGVASYAGNHPSGIIGGVAGMVAGGVIGAVAEHEIQKKHGIEITYRLENGEVMALVQEKDDANPIAVGDHIRIIEGSFSARAVKAAS